MNWNKPQKILRICCLLLPLSYPPTVQVLCGEIFFYVCSPHFHSFFYLISFFPSFLPIVLVLLLSVILHLLWFICPIIISKKISALLHNFVISVFPWSSYPVHYIPLTAEIESPSVVNVSHFSLLSFCCFGRQISYECILSMLFKMLSQIITHLYIV